MMGPILENVLCKLSDRFEQEMNKGSGDGLRYALMIVPGIHNTYQLIIQSRIANETPRTNGPKAKKVVKR